jgi:hypothetical protein
MGAVAAPGTLEMAAGTLKEVLAIRVAVTVTVSSVSGLGDASAAKAQGARRSEAAAPHMTLTACALSAP